jgi:hypothetical protein
VEEFDMPQDQNSPYAFPSGDVKGLTVKQWYAGMAVNGLLASGIMQGGGTMANMPTPEEVAAKAMEIAEALANEDG